MLSRLLGPVDIWRRCMVLVYFIVALDLTVLKVYMTLKI